MAQEGEQTENTPSQLERLATLWLYLSKNHASLDKINVDLPECYGAQGNSESVRRRFERDKQLLESFGCYLSYDQARGTYHIDAQRSYSTPLSLSAEVPELSEEDACLLRVLLSAILQDPDDLSEDALMILVKLSDVLTEPDMFELLLPSGEVARASDSRKKREKLNLACQQSKRVSFSYETADGRTALRNVEPEALYLIDEHWYLFAYDLDRSDMRTFRLERMSKVKVNASSPSSPDFEPRNPDPSSYLRLPFQLGKGELAEAHVAVAPEARPRVESQQRGQGKLEETEAGLVWSVPCNDADALARWCIENGPGLRPLEDDARMHYRCRLEQMQAALERSEDAGR